MSSACRVILCCLGGLLAALSARAQAELIPQGDFEADKLPKFWRPYGQAGLATEDGNRFLRVAAGGGANAELALAPEWRWLRLRLRFRTHDVAVGAESWQDARLTMAFHDAAGKRVGPWPPVFHGSGSSGWQGGERLYAIPAGATGLTLGATNLGKIGQADFDDLHLAPAGSGMATLGDELLANGDFAQGEQGWSLRQARLTRVDGQPCLETPAGAAATQEIPLAENIGTVTLSLRWRLDQVALGDAAHKDARVAMTFEDGNGQRVGDWPNVVHGQGTQSWQAVAREFAVPRGARLLRLEPGHWGKSGTAAFAGLALKVTRLYSTTPDDAPPPEGVAKLWDLNNAWQQRNPQRRQVCLNDLWQWRPVLPGEKLDPPPSTQGAWGWLKVPAPWPNTTAWDIGAAATLPILAPYVADRLDWPSVDRAWYQRSFVLPADWQGGQTVLELTMLQTHALVFVNGAKAGELVFPGGELDLSRWLRPGQENRLAMLVTARPLKGEESVFMAQDRVFTKKTDIQFKGLTGDVYLHLRPAAARIADTQVRTSLRQHRVTFDCALQLPAANRSYRLHYRVLDGDREVLAGQSAPFAAAALADGRCQTSAAWPEPKLWDLDTPANRYQAILSLHQADDGQVVDRTLPQPFAFREFWIDGRQFYLNGSPIHLRALHVRNPGGHADQAGYAGARATCERLREQGFNTILWGVYDFGPGQESYLDGILDAADDLGLLVTVSMPHAKNYDWKLDDPAQAAAYRDLASFIVRRVAQHPSVVLYAMNHNACGYSGDQNPLKLDGRYDPDAGKAPEQRNRHRVQALLAADIVRNLDPTRPIYHHQSGNLGDLHCVNIYLNWSPIQERNDWLQNWAAAGTKPLFFVEWGLPHIASFSSYRGPDFIWRTPAFQSLWNAEYSAAILGEDAYRMTPAMTRALQDEAQLYASGKPFTFSTLIRNWRSSEESYLRVQARFAEENWRAHRTWGLSAILPWDQGGFFQATAPRSAQPNPDRYRDLQRPGMIPDQITPGNEYLYTRDPSIFAPTSIGRVMLRWNQPVIAYLGGAPEHFTERSHNYLAGETVRKQLLLVNDSRRMVQASGTWELAGTGLQGAFDLPCPPGEVARLPLVLPLPPTLAPGTYRLQCRFQLPAGPQEDALELQILPPLRPAAPQRRVVLFDPAGQTAPLLAGLGIQTVALASVKNLSPDDLLIVGREALALDTPLPGIAQVPAGLRVLVFEQRREILERRLGFRIAEHGMRQVYVRAAAHPALHKLTDANFHDWRGAATLLPPYLPELPQVEVGDPRWDWCGFSLTRVWRCGNEGSVASVSIEKPQRGNWLPLLDCGFDLQYSPLLQYREGRGLVIFCQLDVSGRSQAEPAAARLLAQLLAWLDRAPAAPAVPVYHSGTPAAELLASLGIAAHPWTPQQPPGLLVAGPGSAPPPALAAWTAQGGRLLALGLDAPAYATLGGPDLTVKPCTGWATPLAVPADAPLRQGLSQAELHLRRQWQGSALESATAPGNELLRFLPDGRSVLCQLAPWQFDSDRYPYLRTTARRVTFLCAQLLQNLGADAGSPLLQRLAAPGQATRIPLASGWCGRVDKTEVGRAQNWFAPEHPDGDWEKMRVPGTFDTESADVPGPEYDGLYWYRLHFRVPPNFAPDQRRLHVGAVDDESWIWLNGKFLGEVSKATHPKDYYRVPRDYPLAPGDLRPDADNVLVVLVRDTYLTGGIKGTPALIGGREAWLDSYYTQPPKADDEPYRYYRW